MHEMSMVRVAVRAVLEECEGKDVGRVTAVNFSIGEMRDVVEAYVPDLFRYLARGTIAAEAEVTVRRVPLNVRCHECGDIFPIDVRDPDTWSCPRCGAYKKYRVFSGDELYIESIKVLSEKPVDDGTLVSLCA